MKLKQYVVDAFTDKVFCGNPAAVCVLEGDFLPDDIMQSITIENNLSETAFTVKKGDGRYRLRWFTPGGEIDLCGHATLGTAYVLMNYFEKDMKNVIFETMSGELIVERKGDLYEMDFPAYALKEIPVTDEMAEACGARPKAAFIDRDLLCVMEKEEQVRDLEPDLEKIKNLKDGLLLNITAKGSGEYDCVSRSFAPKLNVNEDPVCGSAHCQIVPYWVRENGRDEVVAYQASSRGGTLYCELAGDRVKMSGKAVTFSEAEINF